MFEMSLDLRESVIDLLKTSYRLEVESFEVLLLGADMHACVCRVQAQGKMYFIKLKKGFCNDIGVTINGALSQVGIAQMIPPLKNASGNYVGFIKGISVTVYPFIEGRDGFSCELTQRQWVVLGKALKKIHESSLPSTLLGQIRQEDYSDKWRKDCFSLLESLETLQLSNQTASKVGSLLEENKLSIQKIVQTADRLGEKLKNEPHDVVLCHGDIHGGNVMIDQNGFLYIVDWDNSVMAPKERDLMFIGAGIANVWNKPQEEMYFYQGYGSCELNRELMAYYRCERIVEDIVEYCEELLIDTDESSLKKEMCEQFQDMFVQEGVIDKALETVNRLIY